MSDSIVTVTTAASSQDLTTLAAVKAMLDMATDENDTRIAGAIAQASASIAAHCGRVFGLQRYTETWRLERCKSVLFPRVYPIKQIAGITEAGVALEADDYEIDPAAGMLFRLDASDRRCDWPAAKIVVIYDAGYVLPSFTGSESGEALPANIELACQLLTKSTWYSASRDTAVLRETVPDVLDLTYAAPGGSGMPLVGGLPEEIAGKIEPYRNVRV